MPLVFLEPLKHQKIRDFLMFLRRIERDQSEETQHKTCENAGFQWPVFSRILAYLMQLNELTQYYSQLHIKMWYNFIRLLFLRKLLMQNTVSCFKKPLESFHRFKYQIILKNLNVLQGKTRTVTCCKNCDDLLHLSFTLKISIFLEAYI